MKRDLSLKHITCNKCKTILTLPKEVNRTHEEMKQYSIIRHVSKPQVIDKESKQLREMTEIENKEHLERIDKILSKHLADVKKSHPNNTWSVVKIKHDEFEIHHQIQPEIIYAEYQQKEETRKTSEIDKKIVEVNVAYCPTCKTEAFRAEFVINRKTGDGGN